MAPLKLFFFLLFAVCTNLASSQSEFFVDVNASQQFVGEHHGFNIEAQFSFHISTDISIGISAGQATMNSNSLERAYDLGKFGVHATYSFRRRENFRFESILGASYLHFSEDIDLESPEGTGLDLGIQALFRSSYSLNYGIRIISTYSNIAPGGIINGGVFVRYNL